MKKMITTDKEVDTYLFCKEVKAKAKKFDERYDELMSEDDINELTKDFKQLNLEDDEDISHHRSVSNQYKDIYRNDEESRFKN